MEFIYNDLETSMTQPHLDPLEDLGQPLVLLALVVALRQVDKVHHRLGGEELGGVGWGVGVDGRQEVGGWCACAYVCLAGVGG